MSKQKIILIVLVVAVIGAGMLAGVKTRSPKSPAKTSAEPMKIGVVLPLTGIAAAHGENEKRGIELAIKEINATGGIAGKQLQAIYEDDHTDPKQTVGAITKLITIDKTEAIIGGTWDFLANAAIPVIDKNKKLLFTPSALPDTLEATSPYVFMTHSPVAINQSAFEKFLTQFKNGKIVVMTVNNPWGMAHAKAFKAAITRTGSALVKEVILPNFDNNDVQRELSLIKPLNPDAVLTALNFGDDVVFMRKRVELHIRAKVLAEQKVEDLYTKGTIGKELLDGVSVFRFSPPKPDFMERYRQAYGETPQEYADTAYDAVYVIKQAIENAHGVYRVDAMLSGLRRITNYDGAAGKIDFSVNNYPSNKTPILEIFKDGSFVLAE